jgi:sortase B
MNNRKLLNKTVILIFSIAITIIIISFIGLFVTLWARSNKPDTNIDKETVEIYEELHNSNPDFAFNISIKDTDIDYPVMYTPNEPEKYLHMDINGKYSIDGLPFIDERCTLKPRSDNLLIYGHNMQDGTMFTSLVAYEDKAYYLEHPIIVIENNEVLEEYQILSTFYDRVYYQDETVYKFYNFIDADSESDFNDNIDILKAKAIYDSGITAEYGDNLISLVTCTYQVDNGRFVVVAKKVKEIRMVDKDSAKTI